MRRSLILALTMGLALASPALGHDNEEEACYWKNHVEVWETECCADNECVDRLLDNLRARGPGSSLLREAAANVLEQCL